MALSQNQAGSPPRQAAPRWGLALLLLAIVGWGLIDALGAYWFNHDPRRGLVVLVAVGAFVGLWSLLLVTRRPQRRRPDDNRPPG
ncbi:MAG: hypothetical protein ACC645_11510 [Pirellulales bacterium]